MTFYFLFYLVFQNEILQAHSRDRLKSTAVRHRGRSANVTEAFTFKFNTQAERETHSSSFTTALTDWIRWADRQRQENKHPESWNTQLSEVLVTFRLFASFLFVSLMCLTWKLGTHFWAFHSWICSINLRTRLSCSMFHTDHTVDNFRYSDMTPLTWSLGKLDNSADLFGAFLSKVWIMFFFKDVWLILTTHSET